MKSKSEEFKMKENLFIDCFGYSPFGSPVTRSEID
jgi:hypothetical protein